MWRYADPVTSRTERTRLKWELCIVLALSFGASALYAIVSIIERVTREEALSTQTATINRSLAERPTFDLIYQVLGVAFGIAPVALVAFLLWRRHAPHLARLGLGAPPASVTRRSIWWLQESGWGVVLAAGIGVPGLGFYLVAREIGINTTVVATALDAYWWTIPILVLRALQAALGEELIVVAYLFDRLKRLGMRGWGIILTSALLRGSYHLYQGFGGFIGNVVMGLAFGWAYRRWGRSLPLIIAHWVLDIVSFLGYPLAATWWPSLFTVA